MTKLTYKEQLLDPRWQKKRLQILERDGFCCTICYDPFTTLHIHHIKYRNCMAWEYEDNELITYCKHCHSIVEYYKKMDEIIPINAYKNDMDNETLNIYFFSITSDKGIMIDVFEYSNDTLKYLITMTTHTIYILNEIMRKDVLKEVING